MRELDDLVYRALGGDKAAENEIFRFLLVRFRLFVRQKTGDIAAAEDIAQKACITVFEKYKSEKFTVGFGAWAYGVLKMVIRNYFHEKITDNKKMVTGFSEKGEVSISEQIDPGIEMTLLKSLGKLITINRRYARILNLVYQGFKTDEICEKLGITRNNFYVILNRARLLLWECLKGETE